MISLSHIHSLLELLHYRLEHSGDKKLYHGFDRAQNEFNASLSVAELVQGARRLGQHWQNERLNATSALLLLPQGLDYVQAFFACLYNGKTIIPFPYPAQLNEPLMQKLQGVYEQAACRMIITNRALAVQLADSPLASFFAVYVLEDCPEELGELSVHPQSHPHICYLFTSGSTAQPKGVIHTHRSFLHNGEMVCRDYHYSENSLTVSWLPQFHAFGILVNILYPLCANSPVYIMSPADFAVNPLLWLEWVSRLQATHIAAASFGFDLCAQAAEAGAMPSLNLSQVQIAFASAEPVRKEIFDRFQRVFGPAGFSQEAFRPLYGMSEVSTISARRDGQRFFLNLDAGGVQQGKVWIRDTIDSTGTTPMNCGYPLEGMEVMAVHPEAQVKCGPDEIGELWLRGPSTFSGYLRPVPEAWGRLADHPGPDFFRTGDLGFVYEGEVYITGRIKEVMIVRGKNHYPADIEQLIAQNFPALLDARKAVFSQPDEAGTEKIVAVIEWPGPALQEEPGSELADEINRIVLQQQQVSLSRLIFVPLDSIPRTASGKIQRRNCKIALEEERLPLLFSQSFDRKKEPGSLDENKTIRSFPNKGEIEQALFTGIAEVFALPPDQLKAESVLIHLGLDSIQLLRLNAWLGERFSVEISLQDLIEQRDLGALAAFIFQQLDPEREVAKEKETDLFPFTINQQGLWFEYQRLPAASVRFNVVVLYELPSGIDEVRLQEAFQTVQNQHPVLKMRIDQASGLPQGKLASEPVSLQIESYGGSKSDCIAALSQLATQPFLPEPERPLFVGKWIKLSAEEEASLLYLQTSHLLLDGKACQILLRQLEALYTQSESEAMPPETNFLQLASKEAAYLQQIDEQKFNEFWLPKREKLFQPLRLPGLQRSPQGRFQPARLIKKLDSVLWRQIEQISAELRITSFSFMLSVFVLVLYRYSRQKQLSVGIPFLNREEKEFINSLGYFTNVLPMPVEIDPEESFAVFAQKILSQTFGLLSWQSYPLTRLVEKLGLSDRAFIEVLFSFQNLQKEEPAGALFQPSYEVYQATTGDLTFEVIAEANSWTLLAKYNAARFDKGMVQRWLDDFFFLLGKLAEEPQQTLGHFEAMQTEEPELLPGWEGRSSDFQSDGNLYQWFAQAVQRNPGRTALTFQEEKLTYEELEQAVQSLIFQLTKLGVQSQDRLALLLPPSPDQPVVMLACLALALVYVPLDPDWPLSRQEEVIRDVEPKFILYTGSQTPSLRVEDGTWLNVREMLAGPENGQSVSWPLVKLKQDDLANIIYTSGSTGKPKGVAVRHHGLKAFYQALQARVGSLAGERVLASSHYAFDISFSELIAPLLSGGEIVIASQQARKDPDQLHRLIRENGITWVQGTPAFWSMLLQTLDAWPASLQTMISTGEALPPAIAKELLQVPARLWNLYGPTEATIQVCGQEVIAADSRSIGQPFEHAEMYVLDENRQVLPAGVAGKLYLGGPFLAHSYWKRPHLTREKFVPTPSHLHSQSVRLYDTGDQAYQTDKGEIVLLGRRDRQIKLRGYRIELGEIEAVLHKHPEVRDCRVVFAENENPALKQLKACILPVAPNHRPDFMSLRTHLAEYLPEYMIPAVFWLRDDFPVLANGKVALDQLFNAGHKLEPKHHFARPLRHEAAVQQIWSSLLAIEEVPVQRNFFDLGGTSLMLVELRSRLNEKFPALQAAMVDLFQHTTIQAQARWISGLDENKDSFNQDTSQSQVVGSNGPLTRREIRKRRRQHE
jgi:amino acid adenylation domain-containing protein